MKMKTQLKLNWLLLVLIGMLELLPVAHAYYDPAAQRWLNRDPIEETGGLNMYGFVRNEPIHAIDPFGHFIQWVIRKCIGKTAKNGGDLGGPYRNQTRWELVGSTPVFESCQCVSKTCTYSSWSGRYSDEIGYPGTQSTTVGCDDPCPFNLDDSNNPNPGSWDTCPFNPGDTRP
jgi:hypothetical protein